MVNSPIILFVIKKLLIIEKYEVVSSLLFALSKFLFLLTERTRELGQLIDRQKIEKMKIKREKVCNFSWSTAVRD